MQTYLKTTRVIIVIIKQTREIPIPMYDMYVSAVSTLDGPQSSCLKQISCKNNMVWLFDILMQWLMERSMHWANNIIYRQWWPCRQLGATILLRYEVQESICYLASSPGLRGSLSPGHDTLKLGHETKYDIIIYHKDSKIGKMIATAGDNSPVVTVGSTSIKTPSFKTEIPVDTQFCTRCNKLQGNKHCIMEDILGDHMMGILFTAPALVSDHTSMN